MHHEEEKNIYKSHWTISLHLFRNVFHKIQDQEQTFNLERQVNQLHNSTQNNRLNRCQVCQHNTLTVIQLQNSIKNIPGRLNRLNEHNKPAIPIRKLPVIKFTKLPISFHITKSIEFFMLGVASE